MICFFSKLNCSVRTKLFQTYCNSRYGCELWSLYDNSINEFDVAWRKAVRRVLDIPYDTHNDFIPLLISNRLRFHFSTKSVKDQFDLYCHVSNQNLLLFVLLLDTVFLSVVVILLFTWLFTWCGHTSLVEVLVQP